jgi:hypothetical protein
VLLEIDNLITSRLEFIYINYHVLIHFSSLAGFSFFSFLYIYKKYSTGLARKARYLGTEVGDVGF